jgi:tRNA threonylcarbamoyl adenosine modification protein (Sua5/YciO/YrdC/YwlC family)
MTRRRDVAFEIALADEQGAQARSSLEAFGFLTRGAAPCQTRRCRSPSPGSPEIARLAGLLRRARLVAFPTETVYGLGADATNSEAVLKIYETKGRPRFNPLIVHCADLAMAETSPSSAARPPLAERFWPGPLTLVLPRRPEARLSDIVTAGLDTVGVRIPTIRWRWR